MNIDDCKICISREMELKKRLTKVTEVENVGHNNPIRNQCVELIKMYPHKKNDDYRTCTSRVIGYMKLLVRSGRKLNALFTTITTGA